MSKRSSMACAVTQAVSSWLLFFGASVIAAISLNIFASTASAKPLSADISTQHIELHAAFSGLDILLFGARNATGDIVVVIRGPKRNITLREKERIAGMWIYTRKAKYNDLPQYLAVASTRPLETLNASALFEALEITPEAAIRSAAQDNSTVSPRFNNALRKLKEKNRLYTADIIPISFFGETLFKARIHFPDNLPRGRYTAEIYLIADGNLIASQTLPLDAIKTGFEAWVYDTAHDAPLGYGILCILIALASGWLAHRIFRKR